MVKRKMSAYGFGFLSECRVEKGTPVASEEDPSSGDYYMKMGIDSNLDGIIDGGWYELTANHAALGPVVNLGAQATEPTGTFTDGDCYHNTTNHKTYIYYSSVWNEIAVGSGGVTDHGALPGLEDDDHPQYLLANGTRAVSNLTASKVVVSDADKKLASGTNTNAEISAAVTASHAAVTVSAPIDLTIQAIKLVNDAAATVTEIDTDTTLAGGNTKIPTDLAVKTYVDGKSSWDIVNDTTPQLGGDLDANGHSVDVSWNPIPCLQLTGAGGFVQGVRYGAGWSVAQSDTNAYVMVTFFVREAGTYKCRFLFNSDTAAGTMSGKLYVSYTQDGVTPSWNVNGTNQDFVVGADKQEFKDTATFVVPANSIVAVEWTKDDNSGGIAGSIWVYGALLVRTA